jgi:hypothetical protein
MANLSAVPRQFQLLSTQPNLRIRYANPIWARVFLLPIFLPFIVLLVGGQLSILFYLLLKLLLVLNEVLHMRFRLQMEVFTYNARDFWGILRNFFGYLAFGAVSGAASLCMLWPLLGVIEIHASYSSLAITYKLLGMSRKVSISAEDIQYFRQFLNESGDSNSWDLEIVANQRYFPEDQAVPAWLPEKWTRDAMTRMGCKTIHLYASSSSSPSKWLGGVLADFYGVRYMGTSKNN